MRTLIVTALLVSLTGTFFALPAEAQDRIGSFVLDPDARAVFNDAKTYVPVHLLNTVRDDPAKLTKAERARRSSAIAVTPDGRVYRSVVTAEDLEIFERAIQIISPTYRVEDPADKLITFPGIEVPALRDKSVIGTDERTRVYSTTSWPWRAMGRIELGCSGTVVGPRHVITAGHCVYDPGSGTWYSNIAFTPGQNGITSPYGIYSWSAVISVSGWINNWDRNYDYAMIVTSQNVGYDTGYMSYGYGGEQVGWTVNINGYPCDKPYGTMWHSDCPLTIVQTHRLYYECDTYNCMSGSSVYAYWAPSTRTIYGIHAYGVDATGDNGATRIRSTVAANFNQWKNDYPPVPECGNGICESGESSSCPQDCSPCSGDGAYCTSDDDCGPSVCTCGGGDCVANACQCYE